MNGQGNNIKKYSELNKESNSQKIGIFVVKHGNFQSPTYIRLLSVFNQLDSNFLPCIIDVNDDSELQNVKTDLLNDNFLLDLVIIQRDAFYTNDFAKLLVEKCKLFGIKIIYETDDDLMNIDKSHRDYDYYVKKREGIFYIVENADIVTVSTDTLKSKLDNYNDNIVVIPNVITHYWDVDVRKPPKNNFNIIKVGYIGTPTHKDDIKLLKEAFTIVKEYFRDSNKKIIFEMIGGTHENLSWVNQIPIKEDDKVFPNFVKFLKQKVVWDIALAPLENNNINLSKSELKYLEYTYLNIPGIYSEVGPYKENIIDGYNGLLIRNNTSKEWANAIIRLIEDESLRMNILVNAKEDVEINHNMQISIDLWSDILKKTIRNKNSLLYKKIEEYHLSKYEGSFLDFLNDSSYEIINESKLFDENYYLSTYVDVKYSNQDPILHYLKLGATENCNPSKEFNTWMYSNKFPNVSMDPFVYYILYNEISQTPLIDSKDKIKFDDFVANWNILKDSELFDSSFYLNNNPDVVKHNLNPLDHWINYGFSALEYFREPNSYFSKKFYREKYLKNGLDYWNPLTHFVQFGKQNGFKQNIFDSIYRNYSSKQIKDITESLLRKFTIIIPIFNNLNEFFDSMTDLIRYTSGEYECVFIVPYYLLNDLKGVLINLSVNYSIIEVDDFNELPIIFKDIFNQVTGDIIILNSYTKVTPGWSNKLIIRAYSNDDVDYVSPISNNIGGLSLETINNKLFNSFLTINDVNSLIQKCNDYKNIQCPYSDGSCLFIKKDSVIGSDFENLEFVYDNDNGVFGFSVSNDSKCHLLDDSTYVLLSENFFLDNYSFLNNFSKNSLLSLKIKKFNASLDIKYLKHNLFDAMGYISKDTFSERGLHIIKETNMPSILEFIPKYFDETGDLFLLTISSNSLKLWKNNFLIKRWDISKFSINYFADDLKNIYFNILSSFNFDNAYLWDLNPMFLSFIDLTRVMNVKNNVYFDDYYSKCPIEFLNFYNQLFYNNVSNNFYKLKNKFIDYDDVIKEVVKNSDGVFVSKSSKLDFNQRFMEICNGTIKYVDDLF